MNDFGTRLKYARKQKKITQLQLAEMLGVEQSTISNYENDLRIPAASILIEIANRMEISIDDLLGRTETSETINVSAEALTESFSKIQSQFLKALLQGRDQEAMREILNYKFQRESLIGLFTEVFLPTLKEVGALWESGKIGVAQEHHISDTIDRLIVALNKSFPEQSEKPYTAVFMLPGAEEHQLVLKMTAELFKVRGWKTIYLGRSIPADSLEAFLKANKVDLVVLSVTQKMHLNSCDYLIKVIKGFPESYRPRILVGGKAVDHEAYALQILGADDYAESLKDLDEKIDRYELEHS
jgi:transcriptional regulator with XRE-family HTH domain